MRLAFWKKKGKKDRKKKSLLREWLDAALFAIVAATLIRTFLIEAYTIPTGSMQGTLLINDYLFVSKVSYGPRVPMTPLAIPLVHNSIFGMKSYTEAVHWNYHRLPGFGHIERNDIVVFNGPAGDTALEGEGELDYYQTCMQIGRDEVYSKYHVITRPVDKKENLIKRCVALPGDKLEIKDETLYINDAPAQTYPHQQYIYQVLTKDFGISDDFFEENNIDVAQKNGNVYFLYLQKEQVDLVKKISSVVSVAPYMYPKTLTESAVFPQDTIHFKWNRDNYGPITIPKAGTTVNLTPDNIALYRRVIRNYEGNKLEEKDGKIFINDKEATSYTCKMDYYWMMGDNRHNSLDSRYWGFVPIDHVVGKAWFVWLSYGPKGLIRDIHWRRLFHGIHSLEQ